MSIAKWIFLIYKIPNNPTSKKVYVWRKLKKLGALMLQDAVFILPYSEKTMEQFQWLAAEIIEMEGEATVWESFALSVKQEKVIIEKFIKAVNTQYEKILTELNDIIGMDDIHEEENRLKTVIREYMTVRYYDYFKSDLAARIDAVLEAEQIKINNIKFGKQDDM
jgi:DNA-binding transcriptional regulator PaaX